MKKVIKIILFFLILVFAGIAALFLISPPRPENISWGVNFSQKHSSQMGLDWQENYLALLDDLKADHLKIAAHWDLLEPGENTFYFDDLDWQMQRAREREAKIILVLGMKTPRWPECHVPVWAKTKSKEEQQSYILEMLKTVVNRYGGKEYSETVWAWQVENEPLFPFGQCPWTDKAFLQKEINLVRSLDSRPVIMADSGEGSFWIFAAKIGDIVGTTMYRKVWFSQIHSYVSYPFPPAFYWIKSRMINYFFGKKVISVELQAEPWCPNLLYDCALSEQKKTMDADKLRDNLRFAARTGLDSFYLWGGEWMFWLKKQGDSGPWEEAKKLWQP